MRLQSSICCRQVNAGQDEGPGKVENTIYHSVEASVLLQDSIIVKRRTWCGIPAGLELKLDCICLS